MLAVVVVVVVVVMVVVLQEFTKVEIVMFFLSIVVMCDAW